MKDGTVAVEVAAERALVQWPFLSDISLINTLIKVIAPRQGCHCRVLICP